MIGIKPIATETSEPRELTLISPELRSRLAKHGLGITGAELTNPQSQEVYIWRLDAPTWISIIDHIARIDISEESRMEKLVANIHQRVFYALNLDGAPIDKRGSV